MVCILAAAVPELMGWPDLATVLSMASTVLIIVDQARCS